MVDVDQAIKSNFWLNRCPKSDWISIQLSGFFTITLESDPEDDFGHHPATLQCILDTFLTCKPHKPTLNIGVSSLAKIFWFFPVIKDILKDHNKCRSNHLDDILSVL